MSLSREKTAVPDWTREDYQGLAPFEWLYQFKDDKFVMLQLRDTIKIKAGEVGVKNFLTKWKLFLESKALPKAGVITDNATEFQGQPARLYCGEYVCDDYGVTFTDRFGEEIVVCRHPIMPVRRLVSADTGETKLEIAYKRGGVWKSAVFGKDVLASRQKIVELAKYGIGVDSENAKELVRYITYMEAENYDALEEVNSTGRLGWIEGFGFSPYTGALRFDGDASFRQMFESVRPYGDYGRWLEVMRSVRKEGFVARIQTAASFASVLVEPLGCLPFFVHVWGGTEAGKTVGLMAAASVWASPALGDYIHTFNATPVGQEMAAGFVNSLPLCIDELQVIKDRRDFDGIVYMLTEGIGRNRGARTGGMQRMRTWRNCVLSTGEMPVTSGSSGSGAVNRIIEIDCKDEKLFSSPREVAGTVRRNYGHAGREFVTRLSENMDKAREIYGEYYARLSSGASTEKQAMAAALILTADRLAEEWIFSDGKILTAGDIEQHLTAKRDVDQNMRALEWIFEFAAGNPAKFGSAPEGYSGERWGEIDSGCIYIIKSVFDRYMTEAGYNPPAFLSWAKRRGMLETNSGRNVKRKRIKGTELMTQCVCIRRKTDMPEYADVHPSSKAP